MQALFFPVLVALAWLIALLQPGHSATLRSTTTLQQSQVRIADLFDDSGTGSERVLGPAPAPGGRIVVEAAQAAAIARQFGVAWRPASGAERVVLDRPGRMVARDEVLSVLRAALVGSGAPAEAEIELPGFAAPLVPPDSVPQAMIEQVDYDQGSGRFTATLAVSTPGEPTLRMRLSGRMQEMIELVVPTHRLSPGAIIHAGDLQTVRVRAGASRGEMLHDAAQAVGQSVRHVVAQGQPVPLSELVQAMLVQKGARVTMLLQSPGLSMAATGIANEAGALGDMISVVNPGSGALVDAEIIAPDQVRVSPGIAARPGVRTQVSAR